MEICGWIAFVVAALAGLALLYLTMDAVFCYCFDGFLNTARELIAWLPTRILLVTLLASSLVAFGALAQRPPLPQSWGEGNQGFDVVIGCAIDHRAEMPTLFEQGMAHAGCYFVTLFSLVAPQCEPVPHPEAKESDGEAQRACYARVANFWGQLLLFAFVGFALGSIGR